MRLSRWSSDSARSMARTAVGRLDARAQGSAVTLLVVLPVGSAVRKNCEIIELSVAALAYPSTRSVGGPIGSVPAHRADAPVSMSWSAICGRYDVLARHLVTVALARQAPISSFRLIRASLVRTRLVCWAVSHGAGHPDSIHRAPNATDGVHGRPRTESSRAVCKPIQDYALMRPSGRSWLGNLDESADFGLQTQPGFHSDPFSELILAWFPRVPHRGVPPFESSPYTYMSRPTAKLSGGYRW